MKKVLNSTHFVESKKSTESTRFVESKCTDSKDSTDFIESEHFIESTNSLRSIESIDSTKSTRLIKNPNSTNLAWILVIISGIMECFWVSALKYASGFLAYSAMIVLILASFCCMIFAIKKIEVSTAYAVFVGIGAAGVVLSEMLVFGEPFLLPKILLIALLLFGVIGLKLVSKESGEKRVISELSSELGLEEI